MTLFKYMDTVSTPSVKAPHKTREEYLLEFEKRLLEILKDLFKSINHNFIFAYGLAALVVMVRWGAVSEISVLGSKLALDGRGVLIIIALFVSAIYILVNYQLIRIAGIFRSLNTNGQELVKLNPNAIPITITNVHLYSEGVAGLILALARWQANSLLRTNPFRVRLSDIFKKPFALTPWRIFRTINTVLQWPTNLILRSLVITGLFYLPVIVLGYYNYIELYSGKQIVIGIPRLQEIPFIILMITAVFTTICSLILFSSYFIDLVEAFKRDFGESAKGLISLIEVEKILISLLKFLLRFVMT